jgi:hypothetical protein
MGSIQMHSYTTKIILIGARHQIPDEIVRNLEHHHDLVLASCAGFITEEQLDVRAYLNGTPSVVKELGYLLISFVPALTQSFPSMDRVQMY